MPEKYEEQKIDLQVYLNVFKKHFKLIALFILAGLVAGIGIMLKTPILYQTEALVRVGGVGSEFVVNSSELNYILNSDKANFQDSLTDYEMSTSQPYIRFTFRNANVNTLMQAAQSSIDTFISLTHPRYEKLVAYNEKRLSELNKQISMLQKRTDSINKLVNDVIFSRVDLTPEQIDKSVVLSKIMVDTQTLLISMIRDRDELEWKMSNQMDFEVVKVPKTPIHPESNKVITIFVMCLVLSLVVGYFTALFIELYKISTVSK